MIELHEAMLEGPPALPSTHFLVAMHQALGPGVLRPTLSWHDNGPACVWELRASYTEAWVTEDLRILDAAVRAIMETTNLAWVWVRCVAVRDSRKVHAVWPVVRSLPWSTAIISHVAPPTKGA